MIDFDTDKEIVELTKTTLQEEVKKCRDDICSYFIEQGVDSERYVAISLAKIFSNARQLCVPEIMNKREMPPKPEEESAKQWYQYRVESRKMYEDLKVKLEEEIIKEIESHIFSFAKEKGIKDNMNKIKSLVTLYKMKAYNFGYCNYCAPEPQHNSGPGRFAF